MKKVVKIFAVLPVAGVLLCLFFLSVKYSPVYVYRLITMNMADVYDYQYFENRVVKSSDDTFKFVSHPDEAYVEALFSDKIMQTGCDSFDDWAKKSKTTALLFIRRDTILYEKYFNGFSRDSYFHSQSMAKSFISFLIGAAIDDGLIKSVNDPMTQYIPELLARDARFGKITIKDLLEMRSGLRYVEAYFPGTSVHLPWHDEAVGYYHDQVRKLLLEDVGIASDPGKNFQYCNYNTSYLGLILERATHVTVSQYLEEKLWSKIMEYDALFSVDSKESGFEYMPSRLIARAVDFARFGRLYLNQGNWNGDQIVSENWVEASSREHTSVPRTYYPNWFGSGCERTYYTYQWWGRANCDATFEFFANGNLGQSIYVIPNEEVIIVHCGNSNELFGANDLSHVADCIRYHGFHQTILHEGLHAAIAQYREKKAQNMDNHPLSNAFLRDKGYTFLDAGRKEDAIKIFALNVEIHPDSWQAFNYLAEGYSKSGEPDSAAKYYNKSLVLKPENNWAAEKLKQLE